MEKKDCFAYKTSNYCSVLTEMICRKRNCTFFKTKEQFHADKEKYGDGTLYVELKKKGEV